MQEEPVHPGRIGEFLITIGAMTVEQVASVLAEQHGAEELFGVIAIRKGYIDDEVVKRYIEAKDVFARFGSGGADI